MIDSAKSHVGYLDGLRGIACLIVILSHLRVFTIPAFSADGLFNQEVFKQTIFYWGNGNFPVCIFFVLSGYVLILNYMKHPHEQYLAKAAVKRYFRLAPLIFFSVFCSYLLWKYGAYKHLDVASIIGGEAWLEGQIPQRRVHSEEAIKQGLYGVYFGDASLNLALWTIKIEYWGSLIIFAFCALFFNTKRFVMISVIGLLMLALIFRYQAYYVCLFIYGAMLLRMPQRKYLAWLFWPGLFLGVQPIDGTVVTWITDVLEARNIKLTLTVFEILHCIGACLLMTSVLNSNIIKTVLSIRPIVWIGKISFAMYVIHMLVLLSVGSIVYLWSRENVGTGWAALFAVTTTYALTVVVSMLAYRFIDRPSQKLANKIANWLIRPVKTE